MRVSMSKGQETRWRVHESRKMLMNRCKGNWTHVISTQKGKYSSQKGTEGMKVGIEAKKKEVENWPQLSTYLSSIRKLRERKGERNGGVTQWIKLLATNPDDLRLMSRTYKVKERTSSGKLSLWPLHKYHDMGLFAIYTNKERQREKEGMDGQMDEWGTLLQCPLPISPQKNGVSSRHKI